MTMSCCRASGRHVLRYLVIVSLLYLCMIIIFETYEHQVGLTEDTNVDASSNIEYLQSDRDLIHHYTNTQPQHHQEQHLPSKNNLHTDRPNETGFSADTDGGSDVVSTSNVPHRKANGKAGKGRIQSQRDFASRRWQGVGSSNDLFVFSAYYEHVRLTVEVVALISRSAAYRTVECQFGAMDYVTNASLLHVDTPENHVKYYTVILQCPVPVPVPPAIVSVRFLGYTTHIRVTTHTSLLHNFTVCLPCLFGPFSNTAHLIETVEMDAILGASFFTVYRYSTTREVERALGHYVQAGRMEVVEWNKPEVELHHYGQWAHIQDCLLSNRYRTRYLVVKDLDELVVPRTQISWTGLMNQLQTSPNISSFIFQNAFFDMHLKDYSWRNQSTLSDRHVSLYHHDHHPDCLTHLQRLPRFSPAGFRVKSLIRPERVRIAGIHVPILLTDWSTQVDVNTDVAFVHHYREGFPEFKETVRDTIMLKFAPELVRRWELVLHMLGID